MLDLAVFLYINDHFTLRYTAFVWMLLKDSDYHGLTASYGDPLLAAIAELKD